MFVWEACKQRGVTEIKKWGCSHIVKQKKLHYCQSTNKIRNKLQFWQEMSQYL